MTQKKNQKYTTLFVVILFICAIFGIINYGFYIDKTNPKIFVAQKKAIAQKLYLGLKSLNLEENYPQDAKEIVEIYKNLMLIMYGNMLIDDQNIEQFVNIFRSILHQEILNKNNQDLQIKNVIQNFNKLRQSNTYLLNIEVEDVIFDENTKDIAYSDIIENFNNFSKIRLRLYLKKDSYNLWKIYSWKIITNE